MRKIYCDICGTDITDENRGNIYHLLLDRDNAPFGNGLDIPDVCDDCADEIYKFVTKTMKEENTT